MRATNEELNRRKMAILKILVKTSELTFDEIFERLGYSNLRTVRQDIDRLHEDGLVQKIRGGVRSKVLKQKDTFFESRSKINLDKKEAISEYVITKYLINKNQEEKLCVFLDGGSTIEIMFKKFLQHSEINDVDIKFVTNNVALTDYILPPKIRLYLSGGRYLYDEECLVENASSYFKANRAKYCFLSASNISFQGGFLGYNSSECEVKRSMIMSAEEVFILIDDSKFKLSGGELIADFRWENEGDKKVLKAGIGEDRRSIKIITNNCKLDRRKMILDNFSDNNTVGSRDLEQSIIFASFDYEENLNLFE